MPEILKHGNKSIMDKLYTCEACGCQWRYKEDDAVLALVCPECRAEDRISSQQLYPFPAPNYPPSYTAPTRWDVVPLPVIEYPRRYGNLNEVTCE